MFQSLIERQTIGFKVGENKNDSSEPPLPVKTDNLTFTKAELAEHDVRELKLHDTTQPEEILSWMAQFTEGYFDIYFWSDIAGQYMWRRKTPPLAKHTIYSIVRNSPFVKRIIWTRYTNTLIPDGG